MILPKVRDPRLVTIRRGGTLTDSDHQFLALWAASCAEHVLDFFESAQPEDPRPRQAIERARAWVRGEVTMSQARTAAGHAMAAARDLRGAARHAAYAAGQAGAVAHVAAHDLGAAAYAIKAARASAPEGEGDGRTYAGMPSNWGQDFTVGAVPVFKYLESRDVDEVGYTLRTASLMTDPEYFFDDHDPTDYRLFGIRYLILPAGDEPPVRARLAMRSGPYSLWTIDGAGYVQAGRIVGAISANRTNVGARAVRLLHSGLAAHGAYLGVRYGVDGGGDGRLPTARRQSSAGAVRAEHADLDDGEASATVRMRRPGIAVLSASYDPGWTATVNGRRRPTRMVAPALVAADVPAGTDHVVFRFHRYGDYPELLALSGLTLAMVAVAPVCMRRVATSVPSQPSGQLSPAKRRVL
jgi:hypothetical protein